MIVKWTLLESKCAYVQIISLILVILLWYVHFWANEFLLMIVCFLLCVSDPGWWSSSRRRPVRNSFCHQRWELDSQRHGLFPGQQLHLRHVGETGMNIYMYILLSFIHNSCRTEGTWQRVLMKERNEERVEWWRDSWRRRDGERTRSPSPDSIMNREKERLSSYYINTHYTSLGEVGGGRHFRSHYTIHHQIMESIHFLPQNKQV